VSNLFLDSLFIFLLCILLFKNPKLAIVKWKLKFSKKIFEWAKK